MARNDTLGRHAGPPRNGTLGRHAGPPRNGTLTLGTRGGEGGRTFVVVARCPPCVRTHAASSQVSCLRRSLNKAPASLPHSGQWFDRVRGIFAYNLIDPLNRIFWGRSCGLGFSGPRRQCYTAYISNSVTYTYAYILKYMNRIKNWLLTCIVESTTPRITSAGV